MKLNIQIAFNICSTFNASKAYNIMNIMAGNNMTLIFFPSYFVIGGWSLPLTYTLLVIPLLLISVPKIVSHLSNSLGYKVFSLPHVCSDVFTDT